MRFDASYRETAALRDGRTVVLRLLRPTDRPRLQTGFNELSAEGRYRRFLSAKTRLTETELDYLTDVDQQTHVAIAAAQIDDDGQEGRGLGVARFIVLADRPDVADTAVTVVDDAQGVGLGTLLFNRLTAAALERSVRKFCGEVLAKNQAMLAIIGHATDEQASVSGGVSIIEFTLPGADERGVGHEVLKLTAERAARVRKFLAWIDDAASGGL